MQKYNRNQNLLKKLLQNRKSQRNRSKRNARKS